MQQITYGHLGHFLLDFFAQIWTQGTLRYILGLILVIFEICHFLTISGPFEYFSENGWSQKIAFHSEMDGPHLDIQILVLGGEVPKLNHGPICFPIQNT